MGLRDYSLTYLPPWLLGANGSAWARAHGDTKDALVALLKERVCARMPVRVGETSQAPYAPTGALEAIGGDRLMPRALSESDAAYAARLADAWTIHRDGGTPRGALRALRAAGYPEAMLVIRSQRLYKLDADGELVVEMLPAGSWCFEPEPQAFWSRYAVLFSQPNLPPAWYGTGGAYLVGSVVEEANPDGAAAPVLASDVVNPTPQDVGGTVRVLVTGFETYSWYVNGVLQRSGQAFYPTGDSADPAPLLFADGTPSGLQVYFLDGEPYTAGAAWHWEVTQVPQAVPGEDSVEMNLIRQLTKEWSNAAAVFMGITIVASGRALDYPVRTLGAADGRTLGTTTVVHNYHP